MNQSIVEDFTTASHLAIVVNGRDQFISEAVLEQGGYLASQVAEFLSCHASNVIRALQKSWSS